MKSKMIITGAVALGALGVGAYVMLNKNTRKKAERVINSALDDASSYFKNSQN